MKLNTVTKHENCEVAVVDAQPHAGKLICVDAWCSHTSKHIKWVSAEERTVIDNMENPNEVA